MRRKEERGQMTEERGKRKIVGERKRIAPTEEPDLVGMRL
jgi:hypothetical protein